MRLLALKGTGALLAAMGMMFWAAGPSSAQTQAGPSGHCVFYEANRTTVCGQSSLAQSIQTADAGNGLAVAVFYAWVNYNSTGPTVVVSVNKGDCTSSTANKDYRVTPMPANWNDAVASVSTELPNGAHCDVWFSSDINFEGECGDNEWIHKNPNLKNVRYDCYARASSFELS